MQLLEDTLDDVRSDRNLLQCIKKSYNLQIRLELGYMWTFDGVQFDFINILNILHNYFQIRSVCWLVHGDNDSLINNANKVYYNIYLDLFQTLIDISNLLISWIDNQLSIWFHHRNNDLFPWWPLCYHVDFWLLLPLTAILSFNHFPYFIADNIGKTSLICKTSLTFGKILAFKACTYDFLILESFGIFLLTESTFFC